MLRLLQFLCLLATGKTLGRSRSELIQKCLDFAYRLLRFRQRSEAEMSQRLRRHGFDNQLIEAAIDKLKEQNLLDDTAFARFWVDNRLSFNPRSRQLIRQELISKGVAREVIAEAIKEFDDEAAAYRAGMKKARLDRSSSLEEFRKFLIPYLRRRGFGYGVVEKAVQRLWEEKTNQ